MIAHLKATGVLALRTVIVGTNREAVDLSEQLRSPGSGFLPVGHVAVSSTSAQPPALPVVGGIASLAERLRDERIDCVFVASSEIRRVEMPQVLQIARQAGVDVRVTANLPELLTNRVSVQSVANRIALTLKPAQLSGTQALMKRAFDLVFAGALLLVTAPISIVAAIAIKLTSPGPVFFKQVRVTQGGREFRMIKFRTMRDDLDLEALGFDPSVPFFKPEDDPRITKVGAWLRRLSIDEIPQLLNVLTGEMSIVGPRPLPVEQVNANAALLSARLEVPAGMTGWWQIRGRSSLDASAAVGLDTFYIENWSLSLDLYIVLKTFGAVLQRVGAR
jgi:exopolysaccharide biosynthesis polyprenyl glycosylphosphotransferase